MKHWKNWQSLHSELDAHAWFSLVGAPLTDLKGCRAIDSWESAHTWASAEISWWCVNEASNVLRLDLSNHHRTQYRKWNDHIKEFSAERDALVARVSELVPEPFREKIGDWIRSHLTSAYLECVYRPFCDVHLVSDQMTWYLKGRLPCGWDVATEEGFPNESVLVLF